MNAITKRLKGAIFGALLTVALLPGLALAAPFTNWSVSLDGVNYLNVPSYLQVTGQGLHPEHIRQPDELHVPGSCRVSRPKLEQR